MKAYVFYWLDGQRTIKRGESPEDAFTRAGYGNGARNALDFYSKNGDTDYWDRDERKWKTRHDTATIEPFAEGLLTLGEYLKDQFARLIKTHQTVIYNLPNRDRVMLKREFGEYHPHGEVIHYTIAYATYNEGPYHPDGDEECHYMSSLTGYMSPKRTSEAVDCAVEMALDVALAMDDDSIRCERMDEIAATQ